MSKDKQVYIAENPKSPYLKPEDVFRDPYLLEFLRLEEKSSFTETDLEAAIITNLQAFLLEMGRGFCFEARHNIWQQTLSYRPRILSSHFKMSCPDRP